MRTNIHIRGHRRLIAVFVTSFIAVWTGFLSVRAQVDSAVAPLPTGIRLLNPTTAEVCYADRPVLTIDFYGPNMFRLFHDPSGGIVRDPVATPPSRILVDNPRHPVGMLLLTDTDEVVGVGTDSVEVCVDKRTGLMRVVRRTDGQTVVEEVVPFRFADGRVTLSLKAGPEEYFYGGGVQNGRFSHRGRVIAIENQNSWTDGGVASPAPFYWSTAGYGLLFHTFAAGRYDFGTEVSGQVLLSHDTGYLDLFCWLDKEPADLLADYYQLTGKPVLLPKFGFYEGHLNAYNRDYWKEDEKGILFEDGRRYKESQQANGGIRESLNGGKDNYQFSARAVIDRYQAHDMPLGWLLPNDGYGAGYGQTETLDGNVENLRQLGEYARGKGVEIGLWTQSDLHPKDGVSPLLQRDIVKEVRDAGVRVLKTDVAWVGDGYSFGLNGVADVGGIMPYYGNDARPFIITLDGWAGTQRYAGVWTGDQTGGEWEYIRFHIPTYIGAGLSGLSNVTSDMDGIFGGKNPVVNARDFQWKAFTPMQLNMDGWGSNEKYPHALGEPATSVNRWYLKLKSELIPYTYTFARQAVDGLPLMRAIFLQYPNDYTRGTATQYQYLYGTDFLVAPIYRDTRADAEGNDVRDGIYLPEGEEWIDYFTGDLYEGGCVLNSFPAPLWKLPLFVRRGAIIPMTEAHNNVSELGRGRRIYELYPCGHSRIEEYDDDGVTCAYLAGSGVMTVVETDVTSAGDLHVTLHPAEGSFEGFVREKSTELRVNVTERPKSVSARVGTTRVKLAEAVSREAFEASENVYFYDESPELNRFSTPGSPMAGLSVTKNPQLLVRLAATDITTRQTEVTVKGFRFAPADRLRVTGGVLSVPQVRVHADDVEAYTLRPTWNAVEGADFYELELGGMRYTAVRDTALLFEGLVAETAYTFRLRAVNRDGVSDWSECTAITRSNPLEFAIRGIRGQVTVPCQEGFEVWRLFDFAETGDMWHTRYRAKAVPFELTMDLQSVNRLDKFHYLSRKDGGNGTLLKGSVAYSMDGKTWTSAGDFDWERKEEVKEFLFVDRPEARFIRLSVTEGVGNYGSGRELYVFKVPGTESYLPGDINADGKVDENDLTSYTNYTGLRRGDADFEGYVSNGDINCNGLIDAYDISIVTTRLEGGVKEETNSVEVGGRLTLVPGKHRYEAGELVEVHVRGEGLKSVNALSFALPYDEGRYAYEGVELLAMKEMENLTRDRLHSDGTKALYPTFVNLGTRPLVEGDIDLFVLRFRAKQRLTFDLRPLDGLLVNRQLDVVEF